MSLAGGLAAQVGFATEATVGTAVTPTRFLEFNSETVKASKERVESTGLRPSRRVLRSGQWAVSRLGAAGDMELDVSTNGFAQLLAYCLGGTAAKTQPNVGSFPTVFQYTSQVGLIDGTSFTMQKAVGDVNGTIRAFTYNGCKVEKWELSIDENGFLKLKPTIDAWNETTATGLASASYAAGAVPLVYTGASFTIGGTATALKKFSFAGDNAIATDRYLMSTATAGQKVEQIEGKGIRKYTGTLDAEFMGLVEYNRFVNGTVGNIVATFAGPNIAGPYAAGLVLTLAAVRFDGDTPVVPGAQLVDITLPFIAMDSGDGTGGVQTVYTTTDSNA